MIGLRPQRELLYRRIDRRTEEMLRAGLVREVRELLQKGYTAELNALNTVGYKEIIAYLKGEISLENAVREIQKNTRRYAKRQMTWFRKFAPHYWIDIGGNTAFRDILSEALHRIDTFMRTPPAR
jgi:tRNA dimethylallyltransferase